jgi:TonB family protein
VKHNEYNNQKRKTFLRIPRYPGGKDAYLKFIKENIIYPEQALANKVEGIVYLRYTVDNIGQIVDVEVTKVIGHGCDEEAIRVIRLLTYEPARNRGVKMKVEMKTRINFQLPKTAPSNNQASMQINYTAVAPAKTKSPEQKPQAVYNYTIKIG